MDLLIVLLIAILVPVIVMSFIPKDKWPEPKKRESLFKNWQPDDTGGLPWFGNKKRARKQKKKKYFWDD